MKPIGKQREFAMERIQYLLTQYKDTRDQRRFSAITFVVVFGIKAIRFLWGTFRYRLLQNNIQLRLRPSASVYPLDSSLRIWRAATSDPFFHVVPYRCGYPAGWMLVKTRLHRTSNDYRLRIYYDLGKGMFEANTLALPVSAKGHVYELVQFPKGIRALRWDPMESVGDFVQHPIFISRAWLPTRLFLQLLRVLTALIRADKRDKEAAGLTWKRMATDLNGAYSAAGKIRNFVPRFDYDKWIARNESGTQYSEKHIRAFMNRLQKPPRISIAIPAFKCDPKHLSVSIQSVIEQFADNWELIIATNQEQEMFLHENPTVPRCVSDRIRISSADMEDGETNMLNNMLDIATGEFFTILKPGDWLAPQALYFASAAINQTPSLQLLYSDEDEADEKGRRHNPYFKTDWAYDTLLSTNYVERMLLCRTSLLKRVNGFRELSPDSRGYDLVLRCLKFVDAKHIAHLSRVLYHARRSADGSLENRRALGEISVSEINSLKDYFLTTGKTHLTVENGLAENTFRVRYPLPAPKPLVSLLIPTRDRVDILEPCIRSIQKLTNYSHLEILIIDNASVEEGTFEFFERVKQDDNRVKVLRYDHAFNYSAINNFGVSRANGEIIGLINNDVEVISPNWLDEMVSHAVRPEVGCVGAKLYYSNNTIQHAGVIIGLGGVAGHAHRNYVGSAKGYFNRLLITQNFSAVTGACMVLRKENYLQVGGLDEDNLSIAFNDVDLCLKLKVAGYSVVWTPFAELYHHESVSRGSDCSPESVARFNKELSFMKEKWGTDKCVDEFYSQWLTHDAEDFSTAVVPSVVCERDTGASGVVSGDSHPNPT